MIQGLLPNFYFAVVSLAVIVNGTLWPDRWLKMHHLFHQKSCSPNVKLLGVAASEGRSTAGWCTRRQHSEWFIMPERMELFVEQSRNTEDVNGVQTERHCSLGQVLSAPPPPLPKVISAHQPEHMTHSKRWYSSPRHWESLTMTTRTKRRRILCLQLDVSWGCMVSSLTDSWFISMFNWCIVLHTFQIIRRAKVKEASESKRGEQGTTTW